MTDAERQAVLAARIRNKLPWHSPPTRNAGCATYLLTAACYEHRPHIAFSVERMHAFATGLLEALADHSEIRAWAVLPNHYHALVFTKRIGAVKAGLKLLHGRTAYAWNGEESARGRKVWHAAIETVMKSDGHYWATLNYVHHNPIKHGCALRWRDWPWSSCHEYLEAMGPDRARAIWKSFPIDTYGDSWDR